MQPSPWGLVSLELFTFQNGRIYMAPVNHQRHDEYNNNIKQGDQSHIENAKIHRNLIYGIDLQVSWDKINGLLLRWLFHLNNKKVDINHCNGKL